MQMKSDLPHEVAVGNGVTMVISFQNRRMGCALGNPKRVYDPTRKATEERRNSCVLDDKF